jgi:hypothetical protein
MAVRMIATRLGVRPAIGMEGQWSPWGRIQHSTQIAEGITSVSTAGHGGIKLSRQRNAKVPKYMRRDGGWYEEDCEWCIPAIVFSDVFREWADSTDWTSADKTLSDAQHTFLNWLPDAYAQWYNTPLESLAGKSRCYDERLWNEKHANDLVVISAVGDWHDECPKGMVLVTATIGGLRKPGFPNARQFLVPSEEYGERETFGFVVDPARHTEV